jgi:hypothetical protein
MRAGHWSKNHQQNDQNKRSRDFWIGENAEINEKK